VESPKPPPGVWVDSQASSPKAPQVAQGPVTPPPNAMGEGPEPEESGSPVAQKLSTARPGSRNGKKILNIYFLNLFIYLFIIFNF
jgi:hypothetical protein